MGISRGRLVQAWTLPNPTIEAEFIPEFDANLSLRAEYDVTALILTPLRVNAASAGVDAARFRAAGAAIEVGYAARAAFYKAQAGEQKLAFANQTLDAMAASRDASEALFKAGNIRELDFATEDAAYHTARAESAQMELAAHRAREALIRVLGLHGRDTSFSIAGTLPPIPEALVAPDALESRAIRASLELKERRSRLESLSRRAGVARAEGWIPDVALDVHALQPRDSTTGTIPSNVPWLISGGVRASVPIFDRKQGPSAMLDAEADAELERYYGAAVDIRSGARTLRESLSVAHGEARLYEKTILPSRRRVVEQSILQYNAMQISVFRLLAANREELRAKLAHVDAAASYWSAQAAFNALLAGHLVHAQDTMPMTGMSESQTEGD
jgi:outer membrane protein TolC